MIFTVSGGNAGARITVNTLSEQDGILLLKVEMKMEAEAVPEKFTVGWKMPCVDSYSVWSPSVRTDRQLGPNWSKRKTQSRLASWMPVHGIISMNGQNKMTVAVSDAITPITIATGVCEEDACIDWCVEFFTVLTAPTAEYSAVVRIDTRDIPYYDSVYSVSEWWEKDCGYSPAFVPEYARLPMNSLWYSYHQQLDVEDIIKECRLSKPFGMETVIIDDGWQTDDNGRGYAYCGDWEVTPNKIPDMAKFVSDIHETGMRVILWYSVPFVGLHSKNFERFKDMLLDETGNNRDFWSLDPRYKEVRDFLIGIYADAIRNWDLDGLKLDFIDSFTLHGKSLEYDARRDYQSLEAAIDRLMTDIMRTLTAIKPDVMIEFRQSYIGPAIRKYGNMLRVGDCPNDAIMNRQDVINMRLTSGNTPVHSDMLMWHPDDTVESAALQLASILYSVPQISVKIDRLCEEHKKMLKFYLDFWRENRTVLIDGKLTAKAPESVYSQASASKDTEVICTVYTDRTVHMDYAKKLTVVNAAYEPSVIVKQADRRSFTVLNCMGEEIESGTVNGMLFETTVPTAGMVIIR